MRAHHTRTAVLDQIGEIIRSEAVVDRHEHGADLGRGVEGLEHRVRVRRDDRDAIAGAHAHGLQRRRPAIAALEELCIGQPQRPVDHGLPMRIQLARAAREIERRERQFHGGYPTGRTPAM